MKKKILIKIVLAAFLLAIAVAPRAFPYSADEIDWWSQTTYQDSPANTLKQWVESADGRLGGVNPGTGDIYYVDSNVSAEGDGKSWTDAKDTLDEAVNLCTDNNGDVIYVAPGHNESFASTSGDDVDIDVVGVTIVGIGTGTDMPRFDYDDADGEIVIGAANVRLINLAFLPSITGITHAIEIEADADGSVIEGCWFKDGESSGTDEFVDCIQWTAASDFITVKNCIFESYGGSGAKTACDLTAGVVKNTKILNNYFNGDYSEAPIYSDDIDLRSLIVGNTIINLNADEYCIEFSANATGTVVDNVCVTNASTNAIDPGYMECADNTFLDYGAHIDSDFGPRWATTATSDTTDAVDMTPEIADNSILANILDDGGDTSAYDRRSHSLVAIGDDTDTIVADTAAMDTHAEMILLTDPNYVSYDSPRVTIATTSAMTAGNGYGAADDPTIFTVTGDILCQAAATFSTQVTSTSNDTLELGVPGNTACLLIQDVADGTAFDVGDTWTLLTGADADGAQLADEWCIVSGGDIVLTIDDHDLTAGVANFYLFWIPLSQDAAVTAAAP